MKSTNLSAVMLLTILICRVTSGAEFESGGLSNELRTTLGNIYESGGAVECLAIKPKGESDGTVAMVLRSPHRSIAIAIGSSGLFRRIKQLQEERHLVKWVALTSDGGWAVLYDKNRFAVENIPAAASAALRRFRESGETLLSISFQPDADGFVVTSDRHYAFENVPPTLALALKQTTKDGSLVRFVAFANDGGWVLVHGDNGFNTRGPLPKDFVETLGRMNDERQRINHVLFVPGVPDQWAIFGAKSPPNSPSAGAGLAELLSAPSGTGNDSANHVCPRCHGNGRHLVSRRVRVPSQRSIYGNDVPAYDSSERVWTRCEWCNGSGVVR